jgi:hypothetical protein
MPTFMDEAGRWHADVACGAVFGETWWEGE